jgi:hypothetical protein
MKAKLGVDHSAAQMNPNTYLANHFLRFDTSENLLVVFEGYGRIRSTKAK